MREGADLIGLEFVVRGDGRGRLRIDGELSEEILGVLVVAAKPLERRYCLDARHALDALQIGERQGDGHETES